MVHREKAKARSHLVWSTCNHNGLCTTLRKGIPTHNVLPEWGTWHNALMFQRRCPCSCIEWTGIVQEMGTEKSRKRRKMRLLLQCQMRGKRTSRRIPNYFASQLTVHKYLFRALSDHNGPIVFDAECIMFSECIVQGSTLPYQTCFLGIWCGIKTSME
jgi:hypothetical protein